MNFYKVCQTGNISVLDLLFIDVPGSSSSGGRGGNAALLLEVLVEVVVVVVEVDTREGWRWLESKDDRREVGWRSWALAWLKKSSINSLKNINLIKKFETLEEKRTFPEPVAVLRHSSGLEEVQRQQPLLLKIFSYQI